MTTANTSPIQRYSAFGLSIESEIALSGLPVAAGSAAATVRVVRRAVQHPLLTRDSGMEFIEDPAGAFLSWRAVGAFRVAGDDLIEVDANPGSSDELVALPLLGAVIATLLHKRGLYLLHASAVAVGDRAVALMGDKGAGKSTTAAALVASGHSLLTDDIMALDFSATGAPRVLPAFGQIKLWDDSVAGLGNAGLTDRGRLHALVEKSNYEIGDGGFRDAASPIARLYVLKRSDTPHVATLPPAESLDALMRYSYLARFGEAGFGERMGEHFRRSAELANAGAVRELNVPSGLDKVHHISALIEADLADNPA